MPRLSIILLSFFATQSLMAQDSTYIVKGSFNKIQPGTTIYLYYYTKGARINKDSTIVNGNHFEIRGKVGGGEYAVIQQQRNGAPLDLRELDKNELFISSGETVKITGRDSMTTAKISGTRLNKEFAEYNAIIELTDREMAPYMDKYKASKTNEELAVNSKLYLDAYYKKKPIIEERVLGYIEQHPSSPVSVYALKKLMGVVVEASKYNKVFASLDSAAQASRLGRELRVSLDKASVVQLGATAPEFSAPMVNGEMVKLSDFKGKYVLVDFWASWCGPCRAENPNVLKAYEANKDKNFEILGLSLDTKDQKANWLKAVHDDGMPWKQAIVGSWGQGVPKLYEVSAVPQNFLIDPTGKIIAKNLRGQALHDKLKEVLK